MKNVAALGFFLAALSVGCGTKRDPKSAVQSIASTANDQLIADLDAASETSQELKLSDVVAKKEYYGLSDSEVKTIREAFTEAEFNRLVLNFVDPDNKRGLAAPRWAYVPDVADDSDELKKIEAIDKEGRKELIDGTNESQPWAYPVITLALSEKLSGATQLSKLAKDPNPATEGSLMIDTLYMKKDHEPKIRGGAEVYAIISYFGHDNVQSVEIVELEAARDDKRTYDLRQIVHRWNSNKLKKANITFFEHDAKADYGKIRDMFTQVVRKFFSETTGGITDPTDSTMVLLANTIKMNSGLIDGDDYMDTISNIAKNDSGSRTGENGNITIKTSYYEIKLNDE